MYLFPAIAVLLSTWKVSAETSGVNLLVLGDWGGVPFPPYHSPAQKHVADSMGVVGAEIGATAVIALGDNFYFSGINTDEHSKRFEHTWSSVYDAPALQLPWYLIGGNHDHYGNITAQVEFSKQFVPDSPGSWNFPNIYHKKTFTGVSANGVDKVTVDVVFIDTVDLSGNSAIQDESDPAYYNPLPLRTKAAASTQWSWIEEQLKASTADYLFVAGHFPIYSVCEHGNTQNLVDNLQPLLQQYHATGYLAGHDHCMSVVKEPDSSVVYVVSGNANFCCTKPEHLSEIPADKTLEWYAAGKKLELRGGFSTITVADRDSGLFIKFYDQNGALLHSTSPLTARTK